MKLKSLRKKIRYNKILLNFLLLYLSPTNKLIIYLSQKLDKQVYSMQIMLTKNTKRSINLYLIQEKQHKKHKEKTPQNEVFNSNLFPICRWPIYSHLRLAGGFCSTCFCYLLPKEAQHLQAYCKSRKYNVG